MNASLMTQYLEFVADRLLVELDVIENTILLIHLILWIWFRFKVKQTFEKVAEYQKSGVMNTDGEAQKISFDDF
jgi:ribonucleoside-diphosphate reductase beta chain